MREGELELNDKTTIREMLTYIDRDRCDASRTWLSKTIVMSASANYVHEGAWEAVETSRTLHGAIDMAKLEDYKPMDEGDILKALELNIKSAVGYYDSELSRNARKSQNITTLKSQNRHTMAMQVC